MSSATTTAIASRAKSSWLTWFHTRDSSIAINKSSQEQLLTTFDSSVDPPTVIETILKHEETVYLHKVLLGTRRITMFHNLIEMGGTLYDTGDKEYGFIQGIGDTTASPMILDINALKKVEINTAQPVPTINNILSVTTIESVDALTTSATVTYKARNFVPVPPFLIPTIHNTIVDTHGDARQVLVDCVKEMKSFDATHVNDNEYTDKAQSKSKAFLYWIYLVSQDNNAIEAIATTGCTNDKIMSKLQERTITKLGTTPTPQVDGSTIQQQVEATLKRPFEVLAATSSTTADFMDKLTQLQSQANEKSSKNFKKIPAKYQQMILVASSASEITEVDYNADAAGFFKCANSINAQVMLNSILETDNIDCSISPALATTLLYGSFLWRNAFSPSGFACSVISSEGLMRSDTLQDGMVLDYATKFDMSAASLSKLTKTQVLYPSNVEDMTQRILAFQRLAAFFFKKHGFMSQGLKKVANFCLDNRTLLRTRIYLDKGFIAKVMCAIDDRVYQWLKQCSVNEMVIDTDVTLVDFSPLLQDIQLNRFQYTLPPSIAHLVTKEEDDPKPTRSQGGTMREKVEVVRNDTLMSNWKLKHHETWNTVFRNKSINGPLLSMKCHPCLKFQVRGFCFEDCKNKGSHCQLKGEDKNKVNQFIKELRGE